MSRRRREGRWEAEGEAALREIEERRRAWVPARTAESLEEEGLVVVLAPRFRNRLGRGLVSLMRREQTFRLHLDEFGSAAWGLMDGRRDVGEIADALVERFGERAEPSLPRLLAFLRSLRNLGVASVTSPENPEGDFK